jgi:hypothetical protein
MKIKLVNPAVAAGLIDPVTMRSPFIDPVTKEVIETADVPENNFWVRRVLYGEVVRIDQTAVQPTGREPILPLTTRS